jgi:hypothetical protein
MSINSSVINPAETFPVLVKSSEYFQLKKKLEKGINETIIRNVNGKVRVCKVVDTIGDFNVMVSVIRDQ